MSKARAPTRLERSDAQAPADSESEMSWLVREEARARERSSLLVARLRAANEATQAGGGFVPEPDVLEAPGEGGGSVRGHESGGEPDRKGLLCERRTRDQ